MAAELSAELEAKLLARLVSEWDSVNYMYFNDALQRPVLLLSSARGRLGQWNGSLRTLEISRPLVLEYPWVEVMEVLKHEVAHQFVDECLFVDEPPHGPTFRRVCQRLGIDARATGQPSKTAPNSDAGDRIVDRIRKLLALAQSPNQHEAETAAMAAVSASCWLGLWARASSLRMRSTIRSPASLLGAVFDGCPVARASMPRRWHTRRKVGPCGGSSTKRHSSTN